MVNDKYTPEYGSRGRNAGDTDRKHRVSPIDLRHTRGNEMKRAFRENHQGQNIHLSHSTHLRSVGLG